MPYFRNGLGAAALCPSSEQLAGIQDCTDPCQASTADCQSILGPPPLSCPAGSIAVGSNCFNPLSPNNILVGGTSSLSVAACPAGSTCSYIAGVPDMFIYVGGAALFAILFLGARK